MAYDPNKPISATNNPESISGNIATTPTGVQVDMTTGQPITGEALAPKAPINYQIPQQIPVVPASSIQVDLEATEPEQEATDLNAQIRKLNEQLLGQSAFRTEQETTAGISDLRKTQADLAGQLEQIQAEEKAIPLQLEQESIGRGRTYAGASPLQADRLRINAIRALTTGALLRASQGQLATALDLVDRAVEQKYAPIKEELAVKTANLKLIMESPEYSRADKNRAAKQQAIIDAEKRRVENDQKNYDEGKKEILKYSGIASAEIQREMDQAVEAGKGALGVAQIAAKYGLKTLEQRKAELENQKLIAETAKVQADVAAKAPGAASELKTTALTSAKELLDMFTARKGVSAVGKGGAIARFTTGLIGGTTVQDFQTLFNNVKSLLSLDNVRYLKGQGSVSDAERKLLEQASAKITLSQSEQEFERNLRDITFALGGMPSIIKSPDGSQFVQTKDLTTEQITEALDAGWK